MPPPSASTTSPDALADVERALTAIVRRTNLPRSHDRLMAKLGTRLDRACYVVLGFVADHPGVRLTDLADGLGVDVSTASRQVRSLEDDGLIARVEDPRDRRTSALEVTRTGRSLLAKARTARRAALERLLTEWDPADLDTLGRLMGRLADAIASIADDSGDGSAVTGR